MDRETGPAAMTETTFVNPSTGLPYAFAEARVSGLSVGVPGTLATWQEALRQWGSRSLAASLRPAATVARRGFTVDQIFQTQISDNAAAFGQFSSTSALYLPGGQPPAVGFDLPQPGSGPHLRDGRRAGHRRVLPWTDRPRHRRDRAAATARVHPHRHLGLPDPAGRADPGRPRRVPGTFAGTDPCALPGL